MTERADIWIEHMDGQNVRMGFSAYPWQNAHRIARRAANLARNYSQGWNCAYCGNLNVSVKGLSSMQESNVALVNELVMRCMDEVASGS